ncbi:MAG: glycosyltransferase [Thermoanaerobaculia bacterium]
MPTRCDIHVHSKHSDRPSEWYLERIGSPESFTEPLDIYRAAKARGMDFVTISDHDSVAGALDIAHLPGTFLSSEETVSFPEDGCDVHILVLGVSEEQHAELQRRKRNLYAFRDYARAEEIVHVVAHPLFRVNDRLTLEHLEKLLVLFRLFEGFNGTRDPRATELFDRVLAGIDATLLTALAERHRLPLDEPPHYATTGGSDDHGGIYVATTWTETPAATTAAEYLAHFTRGGGRRVQRGGETGSSLKLARSFQLLAHDYYRAKVLGGSRWRNDPFADLLRRIAGGELDPDRPEGNSWDRTFRKWLAFAPPAPLPRVAPLPEAAARGPEVEAALAREAERRAFEASCRLGQRSAARVLERVVSEIESGDLLRALPALSDLAPVAVALSPYLAAFRFQHKDEPLHRAVAERFATAHPLREKSDRIAWATDTLTDVNGVARTIQSAATLARERGLPLTVLSSEPSARRDRFAIENFAPIWETPIPRYEELTLRVPPVVELVEHCERENYGRIVVSTPGPVGLAAVAAAKLLGLPLAGIYHTDFPRYVAALAGASKLEGLTRSYVRWFYRQMDEVYVSGEVYRQELVELGIDPALLRELPRGVDLDLYTPERRSPGHFDARLPGDGPVLLYVGRVSREKNLDALLGAQSDLALRGVATRLAIVGDGPDRQALEKRWRSPAIAFFGYLEGEELATAYASADLFVFPSRTDTFGNVVLEAMASGLAPVVASEGGPAEQIRHGEDGLVVDLDRPHALADAIALCLSSPALRTRLATAARASVAGKSWDRFLTALFPGTPPAAPREATATEERPAELAIS